MFVRFLKKSLKTHICLYSYQLDVYRVFSRDVTACELPPAEKTGCSTVKGNFTDDKFDLVKAEANISYLPRFCYLLPFMDKSYMRH